MIRNLVTIAEISCFSLEIPKEFMKNSTLICKSSYWKSWKTSHKYEISFVLVFSTYLNGILQMRREFFKKSDQKCSWIQLICEEFSCVANMPDLKKIIEIICVNQNFADENRIVQKFRPEKNQLNSTYKCVQKSFHIMLEFVSHLLFSI